MDGLWVRVRGGCLTRIEAQRVATNHARTKATLENAERRKAEVAEAAEDAWRATERAHQGRTRAEEAKHRPRGPNGACTGRSGGLGRRSEKVTARPRESACVKVEAGYLKM